MLVTLTAFTVAHSLSMAIATLFQPNLPLPLIELLIALSILFLAREVVRVQQGQSLATERPWIMAFAFGLLHGLGFATGLSGIGLTGSVLAWSLLQFNLGVELGQIAFVGAVLAFSSMLQ